MTSIAITSVEGLDRGFNPLPLQKLGSDAGLSCAECDDLFKVLQVFDKTKVGHEIVESIVRKICQEKDGFGNCQQFCDELCHGVVSEYAPVVWALSNLTSGKHFCQFLGLCSADQINVVPKYISSFPHEPSSAYHPVYSDPVNSDPVHSDPVYFLQLTDLHLDIFYEMDTAINCGLPQCCRSEYNKTLKGQPVAMSQKYGSLGCDTPNATWMSLLDLAVEIHLEHPYQFILMTGDVPSHDIWNQTHARNLEVITKVLNDLAQRFPQVPTYYVFGNHDNFPINLCTTQPSVKTSYNALDYFQHLSQLEWFKWLDDDSKNEFLKTGQYVTPVNNTENLVVLGINSNLFTSGNIWLAAEENFQIGNLTTYLSNSLQKYRNKLVYLINHIPFYSNDYVNNIEDAYAIIANNPDQIKGIFEGHEHIDNFHLLYDVKGGPSQIAYSPPALVPGQTNPSFRVYLADPVDWTVLDYQQYRMNLNESNAQGKPVWNLAYQAKDWFQLKNLSAVSWFNFVKTLSEDKKYEKYLFEVYHGGLNISENKKDVVCSLLTDEANLTKACLSFLFH